MFLGREYENLLAVDLICHGVPSRKLFARWLEWLGKKTGGKIIYVGFRDKDVGGWTCGGKFKTKTKTIEGSCDPYYASFLRCETYRESCYTCPYAKAANRPGDITIGDFFEITEFNPRADRKHGMSCVLFSTEKGARFFDSVKESFALLPLSAEDCVRVKYNLQEASPRSSARDRIYKGMESELYFETFNYCSPLGFFLRKTFRIPIRIANKLLPLNVKNAIKKVIG